MIEDFNILKTTLLSLIPPSYIVVPNRELANKLFFNSPTCSFSASTNNLPIMNLFSNTRMDIQKEKSPDNYNKVRGRSHSWSVNSSRVSTISFTILKELYYKKMEDENGIDIDDIKNTPPKLFYEAS